MDSSRRANGDTDYGGRYDKSYRGDGDREHEATFKRNDWLCHLCSAHNFARNIHCFKCHQLKGSWDGDTSVVSADAATPDKEKRGMRKADWRRADWKCASCGYVNFARRTHCNSCSLPKAIDLSEEIEDEVVAGSGEATHSIAKTIGDQVLAKEERFSGTLSGRRVESGRESRAAGSVPFKWKQESAVEEVLALLHADMTGEWMARSRPGDLPLFYNCITIRVVQLSGRHSKGSQKAENLVERSEFDCERLMRAVSFYFERVRESEECASAVFSKPPPSEYCIRGALGAALAVAERVYRDVSVWMHQQYGLCEKLSYTLVLSADEEIVIELSDGPSVS